MEKAEIIAAINSESIITVRVFVQVNERLGLWFEVSKEQAISKINEYVEDWDFVNAKIGIEGNVLSIG